MENRQRIRTVVSGKRYKYVAINNCNIPCNEIDYIWADLQLIITEVIITSQNY